MFEIKTDYLAAGPLLQQALELMPNVRVVKHAHDIAEIDKPAITPCLFYLYHGEQLSETANAGANTQLKQTWLVILVERKGSKTSGENIAATIRQLAGKKTADARLNTSVSTMAIIDKERMVKSTTS